MKLLVFTQVVDKNHSTLGFFHGWLQELSLRFESVQVVCLEMGEYDLPSNVHVHTLGKENKENTNIIKNNNKYEYIKKFYSYLSALSHSYDAVFVHMNQEYVLLGGLYWKTQGTPIYFWRNHSYGNFITRIAIVLSTKVFATSSMSFTARDIFGKKKTIIMPVGVDLKTFVPTQGVLRKKYSVCMVGRVSSVKHIEIMLETAAYLVALGSQISCTIVGSPGPNDALYMQSLRSHVEGEGLSPYVHFVSALPPHRVPEIYSSHEVCLNLTDDGSFDKTIVEAAACGTIPLVSHSSLKGFLPSVCITTPHRAGITKNLEELFDPKVQITLREPLQTFAQSHSLEKLMDRLVEEII